MTHDVLTTDSDKLDGKPLITQYMRKGQRLEQLPELEAIRRYVQSELAALPAELKELDRQEGYPGQGSGALRNLTDMVDARLK